MNPAIGRCVLQATEEAVMVQANVDQEQQPMAGMAGTGRGAVGWLVSGGIHAGLILAMASVYWIVNDEGPIDLPPQKMACLPPPPPVQPDRKPTTIDASTLPMPDIDADPVENSTPITDIVLPPDETNSIDSPDDVPGSPAPSDATSSVDNAGTNCFTWTGSGGPPSGTFSSNRRGPGRDRCIAKRGGNRQAAKAVPDALRWFKRHQSPDGSWDAVGYFKNCTDGMKCEPGAAQHCSAAEAQVAMTGYALLCFLGHGEDHKTRGPYRDAVKKGLAWLVASQKPDGLLGNRNYEHAIATMALIDAYAVSNDPELRDPAQKGVDLIVRRQNQDPRAADQAYAGLGWDYAAVSDRNDSSVTGWNAMALKSAITAGLKVGGGMDGAKRWLDRAWRAANPGRDLASLDPYKDQTVFPYCWSAATGKADGGHLASVGLMCGVFMGRGAGDPLMETLANWVMANQVPKSWPTNTYALYYNTYGIFQVGGERWTTWNNQVRDLLTGAQRQDEGCINGSWDWQGTQFPGHETGRVLSTAYATLCLEVYYRLDRVQELKKKGMVH
jgi:hypothetical protein